MRARVAGDATPELQYLHRVWPRHQTYREGHNTPCYHGWLPIDDQFNTAWRAASATVTTSGEWVEFVFSPMSEDGADLEAYDYTYRKTLGVRVVGAVEVQAYAGLPAQTSRVVIDSETSITEAVGYNCEVESFDGTNLAVRHIDFASTEPADDGLVTLSLGEERFTISLQALKKEGPIWFAARGVYVRFADDSTTKQEYLKQIEKDRTLLDQVKDLPENNYLRAASGQPNPHPVAVTIGCRYARQRFWLEPTGDLVLMQKNVLRIKGKDSARWVGEGDVRFGFGLDGAHSLGRYQVVTAAPIYSTTVRRSEVVFEQTAYAISTTKPLDQTVGDDDVAAMVRFRITNTGVEARTAVLPLIVSELSSRNPTAYYLGRCPDERLVQDAQIQPSGEIVAHGVLRGYYETDMTLAEDHLSWQKALAPGESCEVVLKLAYCVPEFPEALKALNFDQGLVEVSRFWREEYAKGALLSVPEEHLTTLHETHLAHVQVTDIAMPDDPGLINTSVGSSTYGNYTNESCMIIRELTERNLLDEARKRLAVWVKYQGTAPQPGNFTDYEGMYFGAGGFEDGAYNQHHGWALWAMADHYLFTHDDEWMASVADSIIAASDWVFRQRRNTMASLPHSRGWEYGFLPAGSLEDVEDFQYWLSTNVLTWRSVEWAARALELAGHPEAARVRHEADAFGEDLRKGFTVSRETAPLVRLRDGRWVPIFPSRLYRRGRDEGWIRETLEGSVYLLIAGLFDPASEEAGWILDDFQDNRYSRAPYGYTIDDFGLTWQYRAGFSIQPNLLAGLMPHLDRDEPDIYLWMFYNAWAACYRAEANCMTEHPMPYLGFSNCAQFKTSDQANAMMWLRYTLVYANDEGLFIGRAKPKAWKTASLQRVRTHYGLVSVRYDGNVAEVNLDLHTQPKQTVLRFRGETTVDVNLSGRTGHVRVELTGNGPVIS